MKREYLRRCWAQRGGNLPDCPGYLRAILSATSSGIYRLCVVYSGGLAAALQRPGRRSMRCGYHLEKWYLRRGSSHSSRAVDFFGLDFRVRFAKDLFVLIGVRSGLERLCGIRYLRIFFTNSCRLRCGVEQTGGFGSFGFHRVRCFRSRCGLVRQLGRNLLYRLASRLLSGFSPGGFGASSISALARSSEFFSSRWLETN